MLDVKGKEMGACNGFLHIFESSKSCGERPLCDHNWNELMNSTCEQKANLKLQAVSSPCCVVSKEMCCILKLQGREGHFHFTEQAKHSLECSQRFGDLSLPQLALSSRQVEVHRGLLLVSSQISIVRNWCNLSQLHECSDKHVATAGASLWFSHWLF